MMSPATDGWAAGFAGLALFAIAVLSPGCGRPPDTAWLRFTGFSDATTSTTMVTVVDGELRDGKSLSADGNFENHSLIVDKTDGTGILVYRARIEYRMTGYSPPSAEYDFNLYLSPPAKSTATTGTLTLPLAPISLKQWLIDTGAFDDSSAKPVIELTAHVTFFAETDDGTQLEVEGNIGIALTTATSTTTTTASFFGNGNATVPGPAIMFMPTGSDSSTTGLDLESAIAAPDITFIDHRHFGT